MNRQEKRDRWNGLVNRLEYEASEAYERDRNIAALKESERQAHKYARDAAFVLEGISKVVYFDAMERRFVIDERWVLTLPDHLRRATNEFLTGCIALARE